MPDENGQNKCEHLHRYTSAVEMARGRSVLDLACGEGYGAALLAKVAKSVIGVDSSFEAVDHACRVYTNYHNLTFQLGKCDSVPLPDCSVDLVVSFETIEHHDRHHEMMKEIKRVLHPDGFLIISTPNRPVYSEHGRYHNPFHVKELDGAEFLGLLSHYFQAVQLYGQTSSIASLLIPLDDSTQRNPSVRALAHVGKEEMVRSNEFAGDVRYFIAVCSNSSAKNVQGLFGSIYLDTDETLSSMQELVRRCNDMNDELVMLRTMVSTMRNSKFWKLRTLYFRIRSHLNLANHSGE